MRYSTGGRGSRGLGVDVSLETQMQRVEKAVQYADIDAFRKVTILNRGIDDLPETDAELEIRMHRTRRAMATDYKARRESEDWLIAHGYLPNDCREENVTGIPYENFEKSFGRMSFQL